MVKNGGIQGTPDIRYHKSTLRPDGIGGCIFRFSLDSQQSKRYWVRCLRLLKKAVDEVSIVTPYLVRIT